MKKEINVDKTTDAYHKNKFDPNGSYTGLPMDSNATPTQDADDL